MSSILIVEDNDTLCKLFAEVLRAEGYEVVTAGSTNEAIEYFNAALPDLIIIDIVLPGGVSLPLIQELKHNPTTRHIPIICISGYLNNNKHENGEEAGADVCLLKPIATGALVETIRGYLQGGENSG